MWNKIVNPESGVRVSIYGKTGQNVLKNYLYQFEGKQRGGGGWVTEREVDPSTTDFDYLEQELFKQILALKGMEASAGTSYSDPKVGRWVRITTFDGRSVAGYLVRAKRLAGPPSARRAGALEVHIGHGAVDRRHEYFSSVGLLGPFFGHGVANPFQKIEVWKEGNVSKGLGISERFIKKHIYEKLLRNKKRPKSAMKTGKLSKKRTPRPLPVPPSPYDPPEYVRALPIPPTQTPKKKKKKSTKTTSNKKGGTRSQADKDRATKRYR